MLGYQIVAKHVCNNEKIGNTGVGRFICIGSADFLSHRVSKDEDNDTVSSVVCTSREGWRMEGCVSTTAGPQGCSQRR
eukprot:scaffold11325_cov105-Skeletonema_marinoi.AAC.2